ncbi:hypothetical protein Tco_1580099, partial [Tanacetum coccineum]
AVIRTSWTNQNSGRLLYGCPTLSPTCVNFLQWFDPPMCQRSVQIIPGLLRSRNELEEILVMVEEKRLKEVPFLALGRYLEKIHVTWAQFWKKLDKMANGHKRRLEESITDGGDGV